MTKEQIQALTEVTNPVVGETYRLIQGDGSRMSDHFIGKLEKYTVDTSDPTYTKKTIVMANVRSANPQLGVMPRMTTNSGKFYKTGETIAAEKATEALTGGPAGPADVVKGFLGRGKKTRKSRKLRRRRTTRRS